MDDNTPMAQFFPNDPDVDLYTVLSVSSTATAWDIKSAYRRLALLHHPDKHVASSQGDQKDALTRFQQVGFAYAVLGDEKRRKKYDDTGSTDELMGWDENDADGWTTYFEEMFEEVTRDKLDDMKKQYQGSTEELADLRTAYIEADGSIDKILSCIPHSNYTDEKRFVEAINGLIAKGDLEHLVAWKESIKDTKARTARKRKGEKEAREAESMAKELGLWDEFYGSGKRGKRRGKGKRETEDRGEGEGDGNADEAALKALIQGRQNKLGGFFDGLADKYGAAEKARPRGTKRVMEPDIGEGEFARIQQKFDKTSGKSKRAK